MKDHPGCRFVALSGTMTNRSLLDYAHLIELALKKVSPIPRGYREAMDWAGALDVKPEIPMQPGALRFFCGPAVGGPEGEPIRSGFRRRMIESQGVVASAESDLGTSLIIRRLPLAIPERVERVRIEVDKKWALEGDEFEDILTKVRVLRQIACGFYYRWKWPNDEPDWEWLEARSNWNKAVREKLKQSRAGLDSPSLLEKAAERVLKGREDGPVWPQGAGVWVAWKPLKPRDPPPTETIWLDTFLLDDAIRRAKVSDLPCIIWYEHRAVGERLAKLSGFPLYGAGTDATESRDKAIVASINTQREGKNLQHHFARNIFTSLPSSGSIFEQAIGRTHRDGQEADEVIGDWYGHTPEAESAMASIIADSQYKLDEFGTPQKILIASRINESDN
jgi:hypothetical protein